MPGPSNIGKGLGRADGSVTRLGDGTTAAGCGTDLAESGGRRAERRK